jgi:N-acetyl-anhydromuramyl-L-alanine amidase AmpD
MPVDFVPAHQSTWSRWLKTRPRVVRLITLHSAECGEVDNAAEALAGWAHGESHPVGASWHLAIDSDSATQSVELDDIAWHAGPINYYSIGIEQAGRASQTEAQWLDAYSQRVLANTALAVAILAGTYGIPLEHAIDLKWPATRGVCTHADVTRAWKNPKGHTDPGPCYPMDRMLELARQLLAGAE